MDKKSMQIKEITTEQLDHLAEHFCDAIETCSVCPGSHLCIFNGGKSNGLKKWIKQQMESK